MGTDIEVATAIAVEVAKQIPIKDVYTDALQPGARQVGGLVEDIFKTLRLVLAPIQVTAALQDRFMRFIDESIRRVALDSRIPPIPQILGPVLEGIKYEPENSDIYFMFSQLLSASMDQDRVHLAHPAFAQKIRELSTDEAKFLSLVHLRLRHENGPYFWQYKIRHIKDSKKIGEQQNECNDLPITDLQYGSNVMFYIQHLTNIGLIEVKTGYEHTGIIDEESDDRVSVIRQRREIYFTEFGERFMEAVQNKEVNSG